MTQCNEQLTQIEVTLPKRVPHSNSLYQLALPQRQTSEPKLL